MFIYKSLKIISSVSALQGIYKSLKIISSVSALQGTLALQSAKRYT